MTTTTTTPESFVVLADNMHQLNHQKEVAKQALIDDFLDALSEEEQVALVDEAFARGTHAVLIAFAQSKFETVQAKVLSGLCDFDSYDPSVATVLECSPFKAISEAASATLYYAHDLDALYGYLETLKPEEQ